jgi:TonB-linked SusC/RagA family outer membrane protein
MMPDMLNTTQYLDYLQKTTASTYIHPVFGQNGSFKIPDFYITSPNFKGGVSAGDPRANPNLYNVGEGSLYQISKTSLGTDWFDELSRPALLTNHQISASGGTDKALYSVGLNYFDQQGTFVNTKFKRYSVRANTSFKPVSFLRIGQNLQFSYEDRLGGANRGEGDAWVMAYRMVPYIPVNDIKGGWGGNGVGESGNSSNPISNLDRAKDNTNKFSRLFGNVFAEIPFTSYLTANTSFGVDLGAQFVKNISRKSYERSENQANTQLTEEAYQYLNLTWTNTLTFHKTIAANHDLKVIAGTEAVKGDQRGVRAFGQNFDFESANFVSLSTATAGSLSDRVITTYNLERSSLYSLFGRVDYAFKGKYLLTGTVRRDGSSRFGPNVRYAKFPAVGVAWRVSEESFLEPVKWLTDLKLRAGWGQMGSQSNVPANNQYSTFISNPPRTSYDIGGNNTSSAQGYRQDRQGNPDTKWETTETTNFGLDATLMGKLDVSLDIYKKETKDLLVEQFLNGLEPQLTKPLINIGTMRNKGFDFSLNYRGAASRDLTYDVGVTFSRYKNTMTKLNNEGAPRDVNTERLSNVLRTELGQPISSFYGFQVDGFYNSAAEITAGPAMPGAVVGSWRYKDINGDKTITDADRTYLGSPHPDFQMGLNLGVNFKGFNLTTFLFWNQGSEIYNYTKYYTDMRIFVGGVSTRVLSDSWTPTNMNAKLPALGVGTANGYTSFTSSTSNSYDVEDGSYLRAKTVQLGYTLPTSLVSRVKLSNARVYIQAQNLFTITKYSGSDPDLTLISRERTRGDDRLPLRDYYMGVDLGGFPTPKQYLVGLSVTF